MASLTICVVSVVSSEHVKDIAGRLLSAMTKFDDAFEEFQAQMDIIDVKVLAEDDPRAKSR